MLVGHVLENAHSDAVATLRTARSTALATRVADRTPRFLASVNANPIRPGALHAITAVGILDAADATAASAQKKTRNNDEQRQNAAPLEKNEPAPIAMPPMSKVDSLARPHANSTRKYRQLEVEPVPPTFENAAHVALGSQT